MVYSGTDKAKMLINTAFGIAAESMIRCNRSRVFSLARYDVKPLLKMGFRLMEFKEFKVTGWWMTIEDAKRAENELKMWVEVFKESCEMVHANPERVLAVVRSIRKKHLYDETYDDFAFNVDAIEYNMQCFFAAENVNA